MIMLTVIKKQSSTTVLNSLIENHKMSVQARFLYIYLCARGQDFVVDTVSLSDLLGYSEEELKTNLQELEEFHWVRVMNNNLYLNYDKEELEHIQSRLEPFDVPNPTHLPVIASKEPKASRVFVVPTFDEIKEECKLKGYSQMMALEFFNYYESNGWMVGKNKMKKWKATLSNWDIRQNNTLKQADFAHETGASSLEQYKTVQSSLPERRREYLR